MTEAAVTPVCMTKVFCGCGHLMFDAQAGLVVCLNTKCVEYGKDYDVIVTLTPSIKSISKI